MIDERRIKELKNGISKVVYNGNVSPNDFLKRLDLFLSTLTNTDEVQYIWTEHFTPDDDYFIHACGSACWNRIEEIKKSNIVNSNKN